MNHEQRVNVLTVLVVVAFVGLVVLAVLGFVLNTSAVKKDTLREAAVARCLASREPLREFNLHVKGTAAFADEVIRAQYELWKLTPPSSPLRAARARQLPTLRAARDKIAALASFPVPTVEQCRHRR